MKLEDKLDNIIGIKYMDRNRFQEGLKKRAIDVK